MGRTRLRIVGLPEGEAALLRTVLEGHGYEVVAVSPDGSLQGGVIIAPDALTPRQVGVLRAIRAHGCAKGAAQELRVSASTVETHLVHIYDRLGVRDRVQAICLACRAGLLEPPNE